MAARVKIYFDGGYRPEPRGMEVAVVIAGRCYLERDLGAGSSMDAEWLALLHAMRLARDLEVADPVFLGDALAVILQATGKARCPETHLRHLRAFRAIERQIGCRHLRYLKRTRNLAGIELARLDRLAF